MDIEIHVLSYSVAIYNFDRNIRNDMVADLKGKRLNETKILGQFTLAKSEYPLLWGYDIRVLIYWYTFVQ